MNLQEISTQLLYTTVPVWVEKVSGRKSVATGFIYAQPVPGDSEATLPLLITNQHVIEDAKRIIVEFAGVSPAA